MSGFLKQNRSNTLTLPIQCTVTVASYREIAVRITGALRIDTLHTVSIKKKACIHKVKNPQLLNNTLAWQCSSHLAVILLWLCSDDSFVIFQLCDVFVKTGSMFWFPLQLKFKILELGTSASVELPSSSPMFLHEERPVRHVSQQQVML